MHESSTYEEAPKFNQRVTEKVRTDIRGIDKEAGSNHECLVFILHV